MFKVLVACECSGRVKTAFRSCYINAWSCDIKPSEVVNDWRHYQMDIRELMSIKHPWEWDLMVAHPDCTYLAVSGARWWNDRQKEQQEAIQFVRWLANLPIPHIAIENPIGILSTVWRKPDQIIQPWMFGHGETKATCLWLKGLPRLKPTEIVDGRLARIHKMGPGPNRKTDRARTYPGIAKAMAEQWGQYLTQREA